MGYILRKICILVMCAVGMAYGIGNGPNTDTTSIKAEHDAINEKINKLAARIDRLEGRCCPNCGQKILVVNFSADATEEKP